MTWIGFVAPNDTDATIVSRLNTEIVQILQLPQTRQRLGDMGMDIAASTPQAFRERIGSAGQKFGAVIKAAGIRLD